MKIEMTARDRKLLVMLSIFVIVVCIGYWGIYPVMKDIQEIKEETEEQKNIQALNEFKLMQVPMFEVDNENMENSIVEARKTFYPVMTSDEIDSFITNVILDYGLYAYDLTIGLSDANASLKPYQYSAKAMNADEENEQTDTGASGMNGNEDAIEAYASSSFGDEEMYEESSEAGICVARISIRLGGDIDKLNKFIDDFSNESQKVRVVNYSWSETRSVDYAETSDIMREDEVIEDYEVVLTNVLNMTLELYMCEE